jgi:hypothetical protein
VKLWSIVDNALANPVVISTRESRAFWPSDTPLAYEVDNRQVFLGGCRRKQYFRFLNYPPDERGTTFKSAFVMRIGNLFESIVGDEFKKAGIYLGDEVEAQLIREMPDGGAYRISGRIDFLVMNAQRGCPEIVECKTTGGYKSAGMIVPKDQKMVPDPSHALQALVYMTWMGMPNQGQKDPRANIMYASRDGDRGEHELRLDPSDGHVVISNVTGEIHWPHMTIVNAFKTWDQLYFAIRDGKPPKQDYEQIWSRETVLWKLAHAELNKTDSKTVSDAVKIGKAGNLLDKGDWQCDYCDYKKGCWNPYPGFEPKTSDALTDDLMLTIHLPGAAPGPKIHIAGVPQ